MAKLDIGVYLFQAGASPFKLFHPRYKRSVQAAKFCPPLVKRSTAHDVFAAKLSYGNFFFGRP